MKTRVAQWRDSAWFAPCLLYSAWLLLFFAIFINAWVCEDAYISFRVIDNFIHGYGLRWNVFERVQAYTHPLWLLAHLPLSAVWDDIFYVNIGLSVFCSSLAAGLVIIMFRTTLSHRFIFFIVPFALSKCLIDYSTSGLESPLTYLLFACYGYILVHCRNHRWFWFLFSLSISLSLFNRLDTSLLLAPCFLWLLYRNKSAVRWTQVSLGLLPLAGWFVFSFCYYGFVFPNTKYAKLSTGFGLETYLTQGLNYAFIFLTQDTLSCAIIIAALIMACKPRWQQNGDAETQAITRAIALGVVLYCGYIVYIGGDYMMGRFWAFPTFASLWLIAWRGRDHLRHDVWFAVLCAMITAFGASYFMREIRRSCNDCVPMEGRVLDATWTFRGNRLFSSVWPPKTRSEGAYNFADEGKDIAKQDPPPTKLLFYVGMTAYYAGPGPTFIDMLALADPLLARLPAMDNKGFYVGHFRREIPKGYLEGLRSGNFDGMDPDLWHYYEKLRIITAGDIWSVERFKTILAFNAGQYDHYKEAYLEKQKPTFKHK